MTRTNQEVLSTVGHGMQFGRPFIAWPLHKDLTDCTWLKKRADFCTCLSQVMSPSLHWLGLARFAGGVGSQWTEDADSWVEAKRRTKALGPSDRDGKEVKASGDPGRA